MARIWPSEPTTQPWEVSGTATAESELSLRQAPRRGALSFVEVVPPSEETYETGAWQITDRPTVGGVSEGDAGERDPARGRLPPVEWGTAVRGDQDGTGSHLWAAHRQARVSSTNETLLKDGVAPERCTVQCAPPSVVARMTLLPKGPTPTAQPCVSSSAKATP